MRRYILDNKDMRGNVHQMFLSWYGRSRTEALWTYLETLSTFTFYEFATWCGKYSIVSALLHGGINPCVRSCCCGCCQTVGAAAQNENDDDDNIAMELFRVGQLILQRFFDRFPLRLSTYIVKRVVDMRQTATLENASAATTTTDKDTTTKTKKLFFCPCCGQFIPVCYKLCFEKCQHVFCERCFWKDMLHTIDSSARQAAVDVISCIVCGVSAVQQRTIISQQQDETHRHAWDDLDPRGKRQESLYRLRQLPLNQQTLKSLDGRKKKVLEKDHIATGWQQAISSTLGSTQDVRRDKFFALVESNAILYVSVCLQSGVNLDWTNEYGQTALYIAAWRGYTNLVELLLQSGSDPTVVANGGSTVFSVAANSPWIRQHLSTYRDDRIPLLSGKSWAKELKTLPATDEVAFRRGIQTMLIPESFDHPGAGSFFIDDAVSLKSIQALLKLFASLPVDENQKVKKNIALCSERSYFCDSEGFVRQLLYDCLSGLEHQNDCKYITEVRVYPHMRFLNYRQAGTILAPHIDLCRVDSCFTACSMITQPLGLPVLPSTAIQRSTHTFILYLTDCDRGGETCLLGDVTGPQRSVILAKVAPRRGRLLVFPHATPHEGLQVMDVPKILLRGEVQIKKE
jgi:hypothetical protein